MIDTFDYFALVIHCHAVPYDFHTYINKSYECSMFHRHKFKDIYIPMTASWRVKCEKWRVVWRFLAFTEFFLFFFFFVQFCMKNCWIVEKFLLILTKISVIFCYWEFYLVFSIRPGDFVVLRRKPEELKQNIHVNQQTHTNQFHRTEHKKKV